MDLRLNRAEIVDAISEWSGSRLKGGYVVDGVTLDGNGQGATVKTQVVIPEELPEVPGDPDNTGPATGWTELDTKEDKPTKTATAKAKARKAAAEK